MSFGLLLSRLPHVRESQARYDAMLALHPCGPNRITALCRQIARLFNALRAE